MEIRKKMQATADKHSGIENYLHAISSLFRSKDKICGKENFYITLLALETTELSPIITEKCSNIFESWRYLLADTLFDKGIDVEICNSISEWFLTSLHGSLCAYKIHDDATFLDNSDISIKLIAQSDKNTLKKIFTKD